MSMFAIIESGGHQHRVREGQTLRVEKLPAEPGSQYQIDKVLLAADSEKLHVGQPYIKGAQVTAEVRSHGREDKISIIRFKRRKHHMKRQGHRQHYTEIGITAIRLP